MQSYCINDTIPIPMPQENDGYNAPMDRADYEQQRRVAEFNQKVRAAEAQLRALLQETTQIYGERHIHDEVVAMTQRRDARIVLATHGLSTRHLGTKRIELDPRRATDMMHICQRIADAWRFDIHWQNMIVAYVTPQPFELDSGLQEALHLIVDFHPHRAGIPVLVRVSFMFMLDIYRGEAMLQPENDESMMMMMIGSTTRILRYFCVYRANDAMNQQPFNGSIQDKLLSLAEMMLKDWRISTYIAVEVREKMMLRCSCSMTNHVTCLYILQLAIWLLTPHVAENVEP